LTRLIEAEDADFAWMLGQGPGRAGLTLPPDGVDTPENLGVVRAIRSRLALAGVQGSWMMVADGEVVGLCGYLRPPGDTEAEIGYGVAPRRRRLGHASRAVAAMASAARSAGLTALTARTAPANAPSQKALLANGFVEIGRAVDPEDGEVVAWRLELR
jgi:RimJ/RimL family protein N-acetyltransferase